MVKIVLNDFLMLFPEFSVSIISLANFDGVVTDKLSVFFVVACLKDAGDFDGAEFIEGQFYFAGGGVVLGG